MRRYRWAVLTLSATVLGIGLMPSIQSAQEPAGRSSAGQSPDVRSADDSTHDMFLVSIKVRETKVDGSAWDAAGGKPDLKVVVSKERSGKTFISPVAKDTYAVTFDLKAPAVGVAEGDILAFGRVE